MRLRIKDLSFLTGGPFVAILNKKDAEHLDLKPGDRINIRRGREEIIAVVDIAENKNVIQGEIGLFDEVLSFFKVKKGYVDISIASYLKSLSYIRKKLDGKKLNKKEFNEIIKDVINNNLNEVELTYFVSACYSNKLSLNEIVNLTNAIVDNGNKLNIQKYPILDKHSTGGVPGNRTTLVVVPIIAAAGITIPKTSSRAITSASGTADTMEVLANVTLDVDKIKDVIKKTNGCMVWGGGVNLASADDKLIKVRYSLSLDPEGLLLASIMAKKAAVNATHVLIDLPVSKYAKIKSKKEALYLKKKFLELADRLNMIVKVIITDGKQPIGNGIGPNLEARDVLMVLQNRGPIDLKEKSIELAGMMLNMVGFRDGKKKAREILEKGLAYKKMREIIKEQGGNPDIKVEDLKLGRYKHIFKSNNNGIVRGINNLILAKIARVAGAPRDKRAGIYLNVKLRSKVKKGNALFTIYSENKNRLKYALNILRKNNPLDIK